MSIIITLLYIIKLQMQQNLDINDDRAYQMNQQIDELNTKNMLLEQQLLELSSYTNIATKAASMGFK